MELTESKSNPFFYIGTSGDSPALYLIKGFREIERIISVEPGHSVYSISLSPGKTRLVYGTRNRFANDAYGKVIIHNIRPDGKIEGKPVLSCYQPTSVSSIVMMTEDVAVSGGLDGRISIWDVKSPHVAKAQLQTHSGPVLALKSLSDTLFVSVGFDGMVKICDISTLQVMREYSGSREQSVVSNLLQVYILAEEKILLAHHPCGSIFIHPLSQERTSKPITDNNLKASAFAVAGDYVLLTDLHSLTLHSLALPDFSKSAERNIPSPVLGLHPVDIDKILIIYRKGAAEIIDTKSLETITTVGIENIRSASSLPRREQVSLYREKVASDRERLLIEAREALETDRLDLIQAKIEKLRSAEMGLEAMILFAEWCRMHQKPLWELRTRVALCRELPIVPESAVHFYTLANLLEQVNEPQRAYFIYKKVTDCDPRFRDTSQRLEKLQAFKDSSVEKDDIIVDYLETVEKIVQEIEKKSALGEMWTYPVTVKVKDKALGRLPFNLQSIGLKNNLDEVRWKVESYEIQKKPYEGVKILDLLKYIDDNPPVRDMHYVVEITEIAGITHIIHKYLMYPPQGDDPDEVGVEFANRLHRIQTNEVQNWSNALDSQVKNAVDITRKIEMGKITQRKF